MTSYRDEGAVHFLLARTDVSRCRRVHTCAPVGVRPSYRSLGVRDRPRQDACLERLPHTVILHQRRPGPRL